MLLLRFLLRGIACAFGLASIALSVAGQSSYPYFNRRYGLPGDTAGVQTGIPSLVPTDSGYVTFGQAYYYRLNAQALLLQFLDTQGNVRRVRTYGRPNTSYYAPGFGNGAALRHPAGGYIMAGTVNLPTEQHAMLWRFDAQGDTLWTRTYCPGRYSVAYAGCPAPGGGYALVGTIGSLNPTQATSLLLLRTDSTGRLLWQREYGDAYKTIGWSVYATTDGGFILGAGSYDGSPLAPESATYVVKVDALGAVQWDRTFGIPNVSNAGGVALPTADGGYLVSAPRYVGLFRNDPDAILRRQWVYKLDAVGQTVWQHAIGPTRVSNTPVNLHELADGSLIGTGQQCDSDPANTNRGIGYPEAFVYKLCPNGDSLWYRTYKLLTGGKSDNYLRDFQPTPDGGFVGAGFVFAAAPDSGANDSWVWKVDSAGYLAPNGPPVAVPCPAVTRVAPPAAAGLVSVYPNPSATGRFTLQGAAGAEVVVVAATGRVVRRQPAPAQPETLLDLSAQPPGLYLLRLTWPDGRVSSRKLLRP